ncbi:DNA polymerase epsilon subunit 4 [Odontomachus brunneus]|uniref:DNA polymerase epsilon subunit 4 n=1 Tax=Odontomachus brunneus TaxID=486640 RepID=UPI0013F1CC39|nr:DNA polymerase epsilon subunit 4 [Odontomachus brunneus]XP_032668628.1 DNA polymerase epsilon subunit 4 [Odontomachus brunneus]XP_032668629.1 DNA polymerase epsilon subunit 4 [Odontomachus brunneus]
MDNSENGESNISEPSENRIDNGESTQELQEETENALHGDEEQREKLLQLPLGRIKTIIKTDPEVHLINQEAVFLIAKSTELFIDSLVKEAYKYTMQAKKRTVQKRDVETAIDKVDALVFLEGTMD